jgi:hypothetical protein
VYTVTVKLGGREYAVEALPIAQARAWRQSFEAPFEAIAGALASLDDVQITDGPQVAALIRNILGTLIGSMDQILDMLIAYAPNLAADRERIESEAYDAEALDAFIEIVKLAYPFGKLLTIFRPGQPARTISKS